MPLLRHAALMFAIACPALMPSGDAAARPLDKQSCANLKVEQQRLLTREVTEALSRGPDWVKAHLDGEKIERVRKYLMVEESLMFRCRGGGVVWPPPPPLPDRKPPVPIVSAAVSPAPADAPVAVAEGEMPLPHRKPDLESAAETKPSQTVADSDKTAASETKATP